MCPEGAGWADCQLHACGMGKCVWGLLGFLEVLLPSDLASRPQLVSSVVSPGIYLFRLQGKGQKPGAGGRGKARGWHTSRWPP